MCNSWADRIVGTGVSQYRASDRKGISMQHVYRGSLAVVIAALLWSADGLLRRELYGLPPSVVVFWEHLLGLIILLPFILSALSEFRKFTKRQWYAIIGVSGLSGALGTYFYTSALLQIQFIPFSVVVLLQQLQPLFAITAGAILLREPLSRRFLVYAAVALGAAFLVSFPDRQVNFDTGQGTIIAAVFALLAAACWGTSTAFSRYTLQGTSFLHTTAIRFAATPVFAFLLILSLGQSSSMGMMTGAQWQYLLLITFSTGLVALAIYYYGLQQILASRSTILELTWPLSAVLIGFFFLNEQLTWSQWLGMGILLVTMVAVTREAAGTTIQQTSENGTSV